MNRENIFRDVCQVLGLTQIENSWVKTLGAHLGVEQEVGDDYEKRVFVSCFANGTSTNSGSVEIFDTFADFPATGDDNTLYVAKDANVIYRYDSSFNTYFLLNDPDVVNPDAPEEGATYYVRLATSSTLNACTYNNGTAGVGATLTGNVNGVLSQSNQTGRIDATVPVLGDVILVKNQSAALQNGIYEVTQLGSGSQPFVLTRIDGYNETDEIYPSIVFVSAGSSNINRYFTQSTANPTIGVSSLVYGVSTVSFPVSTIVFADTYTNSTTEFPGAFTYTSGTTYTNAPGYGAKIRANANGALGTINGVNMTSGRRILINDASTPLLNGDYTVTNAGSATQRWQLTRINYQSGGFLNTVREWYVSNPLSDFFGSRWACSNQTINTSQVGISQAINFSQQNVKGLKTSPNSIHIDGSAIDVSDFSIETDNTVGFGVYNGLDESEFQVQVGSITARVSDGTNESNTNINATGINLATLNTNTPGNDNYIDITGGQITIEYFDTFQNKISIYDNLEIYTDNGNQTVSLDPLNKTIQIDATDGSNDSYLFLDGGIAHKAKLFSTGDVEIIADNGNASLICGSELLLQGALTTTLRSNTDSVNIEAGTNTIKVDGVNNEVILSSTLGLETSSINVNGGRIDISCDNTNGFQVTAPGQVYMETDYFEVYHSNTSRITKTDLNGGVGDGLSIRQQFGTIEIANFDATDGRIYITSTTERVVVTIPTYANDAAADADTDLPSGGLYKVTGNRAVFQKP